MRKYLLGFTMLLFALVLTACWPGEVGVETTFNGNGSGTRTFVIDIMDDTLASEAIQNPDDPNDEKDKGPVVNDKHITGGLLEIQTWLKDNSPDFIEVLDVKTEGYHRYFTFQYDFSSFDDFLDKYKKLINLSPNLSWDDFDEDERPTLTTKGLFKKELVFTESKTMLEASLDWALDGIYEDIYDAADLAGFVTKADISELFSYKVIIGDDVYEQTSGYDATEPDGDEGDMGRVVYFDTEKLESKGTITNTGLVVGAIIGGVAIVGAVGLTVFFVLKKRK